MILESQNKSKTKQPTVMNVQITENKLLELYIEVDDLYLEYVKYQKENGLYYFSSLSSLRLQMF